MTDEELQTGASIESCVTHCISMAAHCFWRRAHDRRPAHFRRPTTTYLVIAMWKNGRWSGRFAAYRRYMTECGGDTAVRTSERSVPSPLPRGPKNTIECCEGISNFFRTSCR
jgi:hypothetical protein